MAENTREATALVARYEAAVGQAREFMGRLRLSQAALAERLDVAPSSLSRFLSGDPQAVPEPGRTGKIEMLERIEALCNSYSIIADEPFLTPPTADSADDRYVLAHNHHLRLRNLFQRFERSDAVQGLGVVAELCAMAEFGPPAHRAAMATSTAMRLAFLAARQEAQAASPQLLTTTVERLMKLEQVALDSVEEARSAETRAVVPARISGYCGFGIAFCGLWLRDKGVIGQGRDRLLRAAASVDGITGGHWENLLLLTEELRNQASPGAATTTAAVASLIRTHRDETVRHLLRTREYPVLRRAWSTDAPDLIRWIDEAPEGA